MDLALNAFDLRPQEVRDRFDWAARQGQPRWFWPDIAVEEWRDALEQIASTATQVLIDGSATKALAGSADAMGIAGYTSGMGPLLGHWLQQGKCTASPEVRALFGLHLDHNRARMQAMRNRGLALAEQFARAGIEVTILKGMQTAFIYFPEPGARPLSDLDILVAASDLQHAQHVLHETGFRAEVGAWRKADSPAQPRSLCFVHADDPWSVDLHSSLNRRYSAGAPVVRVDDARLPGDTAPWPISSKAQVLRQPQLLLHLAVHASSGAMSLTLMRLVELVLVIRRDVEAGHLSWDGFLEAAERASALGSVYPALRLCEQLAPGTVPPAVIDASAREVPPKARRVIERMTPANAHSVVRCSLEERFMWTPSASKLLTQILHELVPPGAISVGAFLRIYRARAWRLARRTLTR